MERDVQTEREMPRDISYYRERATQYNQVLFETSVVLNGGVPSKDVWSVADLPRMVERVVQRAEAAESRVRELEQSVVDMRDRVILERERREQVEAQVAAEEDEVELKSIALADLTSRMGQMVERLKKLEQVAKAAQTLKTHRTRGSDTGDHWKIFYRAIVDLDGDGNG